MLCLIENKLASERHFCAEKSELECLRKLRSFGAKSDVLATFYNAVICILILFGSVCWGGNISNFVGGRLEKIERKEQVMLWESHWTVLRPSVEKNP